MTNKKPTMLSGIQPSGHLTLGNYIGAISNWIKFQETFDSLFLLVDLHTITVRQDPIKLRESTYDLLALYQACGLDFDHHLIFLQSSVPEHSELAWILNCFTYMGELNRMIQFKDKSKRHEENVNVGLFNYPVLMAADILLYGTHLVPVGEDQKQHLELARDIAIRFNNIYGEVLTIPEPYIPELGARVMSLQEPLKKMSKSDQNAGAYISMLDSPDEIIKKFKRAVTDSDSEIRSDPSKPGVSNLMMILSAMTGQSLIEIEKNYEGKGYGQFKNDVADAVIARLKPIQDRFYEIRPDTASIRAILRKNADQARVRASVVLNKVREAIGFVIV